MRYLTDLLELCSGTPMRGLTCEALSRTGKKRVNILAIGDVGGTLLTGLVLLGGDTIHTIGICDMNENVAKRYECEMNQIAYPFRYDALPTVEIVESEQLFNCDAFVFCASKAVPAVGAEKGKDSADMRMVQFEANRLIVEIYAKKAAQSGFQGLFAVVSDPVDPLCKAAFLQGLSAGQVQGYGLGVMNSRAAYYAKQDPRFASFLTEGRAFGPHGGDLVIANSIEQYDDRLSRELTELAVKANLHTRSLGFKPYMAPALSSGAISLLLTLRGQWHYSSTYLGTEQEGAFFGANNRMTGQGVELEIAPLPEALYQRIKSAYQNLRVIL